MPDVRILCYPSSASATEEARGNVLISGSYGGEYNAYHAAKWGIRGVILNDAGVGKDNAGISGLDYLDRIGLPAATADAASCHIGDGEHALAHGVVSYANRAAGDLGCRPGMTVRDCAERMRAAPVVTAAPPPIAGGKRFVISDKPGEPRVLCVDAAPMIEEGDAGAIVITGSHAALFRGEPDGLIAPALLAVFFNDAGVGLDGAGIKRLALLDQRKMVAATVAASSAPIGNSREIYRIGILSHVNDAARAKGATPGVALKDFVARLVEENRSAG